MKSFILSILISLGLHSQPVVIIPAAPAQIPIVVKATSTPASIIKKTAIKKKIVLPIAEFPIMESTSTKVTLSTSSPEKINYYDEVRPIEWKIEYKKDGAEVLVSIDAPVYTFGGLSIDTMTCYSDKESMLKKGDNYSFYSAGYEKEAYCNLRYYQNTIKGDIYVREIVPVDFIKIKSMI